MVKILLVLLERQAENPSIHLGSRIKKARFFIPDHFQVEISQFQKWLVLKYVPELISVAKKNSKNQPGRPFNALFYRFSAILDLLGYIYFSDLNCEFILCVIVCL